MKIKYFKNAGVAGQAGALNYGIKKCTGKYIFRIDADDEMLQERLRLQTSYMEKNSNIVMTAGGRTIFKDGKYRTSEVRNIDLIDINLLIKGNPIVHSTVAFRSKILKTHDLKYDTKLVTAQDYELWFKIIRVGLIKYIQKPLIIYNEHIDQISNQKRFTQSLSTIKIKVRNITFAENKIKFSQRIKALLIVIYEILSLLIYSIILRNLPINLLTKSRFKINVRRRSQ